MFIVTDLVSLIMSSQLVLHHLLGLKQSFWIEILSDTFDLKVITLVSSEYIMDLPNCFVANWKE